MPLKALTGNASGFFIWFDIANKKEYYATPINHYRNKIVHIKSSKYRHIFYDPHFSIPKASPKRNQTAVNKHFIKTKLLDMEDPFEEQLGRLVINFINCRLDTYENAYRDFFCLYGFELLSNTKIKTKDQKNNQLKIDYESPDDFKRITRHYFDSAQRNLIKLQNQFKDCINYVYNLNNNGKDENYNHITKFQAFAIKNDMIKYSEKVDMLYATSPIFNNSFQHVKLSELNKLLNKDGINIQTGNKYSSLELSSILFVVLNELINNDITIKICKNCGRYFIPLNRHAEVYCDLPHINNTKKTCRELGARTSYTKTINEVEGLLIYRRTYQKRLMELSRNPNATDEEKEKFNTWKKSAQSKIKEFKSGKIDEKELNDWMIKNRDF